MSAPPPPITGETEINIEQIDLDRLGKAVVCFSETIYRANGVWEGPDPLTPIIPLFLLQIMIAIICSRIVNFALKPFNLPPIIPEMLSGILLGPSVFGRFGGFRKLFFPNYNFEIIETMAHFALVLFAFITGLQMDIKTLWQTGTKSRVIALTGTILPFLVGTAVFFCFYDKNENNIPGFLFCGGALTVTGFSALANILDTQRILNTEVGKIAVSSAMINDTLSWFFLSIGLASTGYQGNVAWAIVCTGIYIIICVHYLRPCLHWTISKTSGGQGYSEFYICSMLVGMSLSGVLTDALGTHPMIGAFFFGLIVPSEVLGTAMLDRLEDFVMGILMPVFYVVCGLRTNVSVIANDSISFFIAISLIVFSCTAKIISSLVASCIVGMTAKEAIGVGVLTNTKSIMALIILEVGQLEKVLTTQVYTIMVIATLLMTIIVMPMTKLYRPTHNMVPYKRRTIQSTKPEEELRILACVYATTNAHSVISLLESSNPSKMSPIAVYGVQLVELVGRLPAMLVVHNTGSGRHIEVLKNMTPDETQTSQIISAFDNYELRSEWVGTQVMTCRSTFSNMAEDVCKLAKEKRTSFVILPFHKQQGADGEMKDINPVIQSVNEGVLINAPCTVGILVERRPRSDHINEHPKNIVMLYLGGPDDREALSYAWRMSEHPDVNLTVIRFVPAKETFSDEIDPEFELLTRGNSFVAISIDAEKDKVMDEEFLNSFKTATENEPSVTVLELVLDDEEEFIKAIKSLDNRNYNLYVVGRGRGVTSPLTAGLIDWCECPELGAIGDLLVTSEFESSFSVLVVQRYMRTCRSGAGSVISAESISQRMDADMQAEMGFRLSFSETDGAFDSSVSSFSRRQTEYHHML